MKIDEYVETIEQALENFVPQEPVLYQKLLEAMRYSLLDGGKRIRPILVLEFCRVCGGDVQAALPYACAVEMIHTYSLIHDDLPCMDDDAMRRGKPSNHTVFGEDTALLAGDALLTLAFETMLAPEHVQAVGAERAAAAAQCLAHAAGAHGMVGGQVIDLMSEGQQIPLETLQIMDEHKTGALILAAARMGCILAGQTGEHLKAAEQYSSSLGLAFQIVDDILDVTGDAAVLGKPLGSDEENQKCTYVSILGLEKAEEWVQKLTQRALKELQTFSENTEFLEDLAKKLATRKK